MASQSGASTVSETRVTLKARRRTDHGGYRESRSSQAPNVERRRTDSQRDPRRSSIESRRSSEKSTPSTASRKRSRKPSSSPTRRSKLRTTEKIDYNRLYFVVDTNYLFKDPNLECRFFTYPGIPGLSSIAANASPLILIPYAVIKELDGLKKTSHQARKANLSLSAILGDVRLRDEDQVAAGGLNGPIRRQLRSDHDRLRKKLGRSATNDELILASAEKLAETIEEEAEKENDSANAGKVVLLTDDVNLKIMPAEVHVSRISHDDLRKYRKGQPEELPSGIMPVPPAPLPARAKPVMEVVSNLRNAQKLLGRLGAEGIVRVLGSVAKESLEKAYGELWEAMCLRRFPEPWSPCDVLNIFDHYAFSVFECEGWKKGVKDAAVDAKDQLQKIQAGSDARLSTSDVRVMVKSLRGLIDQFPWAKAGQATKNGMEALKKLLEEIDAEAEGKVEPMTCDSGSSIQEASLADMEMDVDM